MFVCWLVCLFVWLVFLFVCLFCLFACLFVCFVVDCCAWCCQFVAWVCVSVRVGHSTMVALLFANSCGVYRCMLQRASLLRIGKLRRQLHISCSHEVFDSAINVAVLDCLQIGRYVCQCHALRHSLFLGKYHDYSLSRVCLPWSGKNKKHASNCFKETTPGSPQRPFWLSSATRRATRCTPLGATATFGRASFVAFVVRCTVWYKLRGGESDQRLMVCCFNHSLQMREASLISFQPTGSSLLRGETTNSPDQGV